MNRRTFLRKAGTGAALVATTGLPLQAWANTSTKNTQLTILHTNDVHSRIEPFPMDGGKYQGKGGAAKRAALIKRIRAETENVLLLDAGDMFQGTPYFNFFGGELEFKLMSRMGYDAATIGNHDFDGGLDGLHKQFTTHANFPLINCNYDFSDTIMNGLVIPHKVFKKGGIKIGVLGVGIKLDGLVPEALFGKTRYLDPITHANQAAALLRHDLGCHYVICLSHIGYSYESDKVSDLKLAQNSQNIDLIIGGHTHTLLDEATVVKNQIGEAVVINQVGWAGIALGRIDVVFERCRRKKCVTSQNTNIQ